MHPYLAELERRVLTFDGAMGTMLYEHELPPEATGGIAYHGSNEAFVLWRPDIVEDIHAAYLAAGADVLETATFAASRLKLAEGGMADRVAEVNRSAVALARAAMARVPSDRPRFVAGAMGPTGMLLASSDPALSRITFDELSAVYEEQAAALVDGGADLLLLETAMDLEELRAAVSGIARAFTAGLRRVPIQVHVTLDVTGRMLLGPDIRTVCATLDALSIDVIGVNCSTGTAHMHEAARYLCETSRCRVAIVPNAGLPNIGPNGETVYPETPAEMAASLRSFVTDFGVSAVGGCCGTTPDHIAALARAVAGLRGRTPGAHAESPVPDAPPVDVRTSVTQRTTLHAASPSLHYGVRTIDPVDPIELWQTLDLNVLYRSSWGGSNVKGAQWRALVRDEFEPRLRRLQETTGRTGLLEPRAVYGYFPAAAEGDNVILYSPSDATSEIARFPFVRQSHDRRLCVADFVYGNPDRDFIALQVVSIGAYAGEQIATLQQRGEYSESYFLEGFVACVVDALAEWTHQRIRAECGLAVDAGARYAWGSSESPDRSQLETVWELLDAGSATGATLTASHQIVPEHSSAAIVVRHPQAMHFKAASREAQLA